jgi:TrwC relaxase
MSVARSHGKVPAFDHTFSAPKSVSLLYAYGDEQVRSAVVAAHPEAVSEAFGYMEERCWVSRLSHRYSDSDGSPRFTSEQVGSEGYVAAGFVHFTSRANVNGHSPHRLRRPVGVLVRGLEVASCGSGSLPPREASSTSNEGTVPGLDCSRETSSWNPPTEVSQPSKWQHRRRGWKPVVCAPGRIRTCAPGSGGRRSIP